jgi:intracellular sulfur oxidation DsrE/DsrF family protein
MMRKLLFVLCIYLPAILTAQQWVTPVIEGYGKIKYSRDVAVQPDTNLEYKMVYKITTSETREGINKGLNGIAHAINMLGCANILNTNVKIVATIQGPATTTVLKDSAYQEKFGKKNPNTEVIKLLSNYGVKLFVCSQATAYKKIENSQINQNVEEALSGSSVLINYQLNGYALMQ